MCRHPSVWTSWSSNQLATECSSFRSTGMPRTVTVVKLVEPTVAPAGRSAAAASADKNAGDRNDPAQHIEEVDTSLAGTGEAASGAVARLLQVGHFHIGEIDIGHTTTARIWIAARADNDR